MAELTCPTCKTPLKMAGFTHRCPACKGAWIAEDVVVGMLEERASTLIELPWRPRGALAHARRRAVGSTDEARACADCGEAMQMVDLGDVELDRCPSHGIWFDDTELVTLLGEAKQFVKPETKHASLLDALKHVFKR